MKAHRSVAAAEADYTAARSERPSALRDHIRKLRSYKALYLMFVPGLLILLVNNYFPIFGIFIAFKDVNYVQGIFGSPWTGLKNFEFLFRNPDAARAVRNTLLYGIAFIGLTTLVSVAVALLFNELRTKYIARAYQTLIILPYFLSMVIVSYLAYAFLSPENGFLNIVLGRLGMAEISWYTNAEYWPYILTLITLWKGVGYTSIVYIAGISGIDPEYYEAAVIDGANRWQQAMSITVPMIRPLIIVMSLLALANIFVSDFGLFYQVTLNSGLLYDTTDVVDTFVYRSLLTLNDVGMSSAAALLQSLVGFTLVLSMNAIVRKINPEESLF